MADRQLSADEAAVAVADQVLGKSAGGMPTSQMGAEGGLSSKAPGKPMNKADEQKCSQKSDDGDDGDEGEGDEGEGDEEMEKEKEKARKSEGIGADELMKAMDVLESTAEGVGGEPDRRAELATKVADGTISKAERSELFELLGGRPESEVEGEGEVEVNKSFQQLFASDDQLAKDYEVSTFIERHSQLVAESLDSLREGLSKSATEQQVFNRALAKSFRGIGSVIADQQEMIKSLAEQNSALAERLGVVERAPNQRKGLTGARPMQKSFAGGQPAAGGLSEAQITEGLNQIMVKSRSNNFIAPCGEPIDRAITMYETERKITRGMLGDVANELGVSLQLQ